MLEIYNYSQASLFARDAWSEKKKRNSNFSLRAWAKHLGFSNNAPLSLMLSGKRPIPKKYVPAFIESLDLSPNEGLYFETLVEFERSKSVQQKNFYQERLRTLSPVPAMAFHEIESFKYLGNPLHTMLLEMSDLDGFQANAAWIQSHLRTEKTVQEISEAVDRLMKLGLLTPGPNGTWLKTQKHLTNRPDIADQGSQEYHRNVSQLAADQVSLQSVLEREFNGYAINIKSENIPVAKKLIREFIQDFAHRIEATPQTGDNTYQLNVQFFAVTTTSNQRKPV